VPAPPVAVSVGAPSVPALALPVPMPVDVKNAIAVTAATIATNTAPPNAKRRFFDETRRAARVMTARSRCS
jgi:hypothetical protein